MMRRIMLALFFILLVVTSAWPKFKEDEQKYLNDQFKAIQDQVQALTTQLQTLNAQLLELRQNQARFQMVIDSQQRSLKELNDIVRSMQLGSEENFSSLKTGITQARKDTLAEIKKLGGERPQDIVTTGTPKQQVQGYVTDVKGDGVMLDVGSSSQGIQQGSRLAVYKASDTNTQVGLIEITQVIDAGNSRARIVTLNAGVQLAWGDVARLE